MAIKNYKFFSFKNGLKGFEGNKLDFNWDRNVKLVAYQTNLKEKHSPSNPALRIIFRDTIKNHNIQYSYFFDNAGEFIKGFSAGTNGETHKSFPHKEQNNLDYLVLHGNSIQNMLKDQEIPQELQNYKIIEALKNNSIEEVYKQE